jgi:hypothetical protein
MCEVRSDDNTAHKARGLARFAIWIGGSALVGSLALVIWNRRALKSMRDAPDVPGQPKPLIDDEIY